MKYLVIIACLGMASASSAWTLDSSKSNTSHCPQQVKVDNGDDGAVTLLSVQDADGMASDVRWATFQNINNKKTCSKSHDPFTRIVCEQSTLDNDGYHYAYCAREGFFLIFPCSPANQRENHEGGTFDLKIQNNELSFEETDHTKLQLRCSYSP